jgi:DNA-binding transcriptional MocR family regulator
MKSPRAALALTGKLSRVDQLVQWTELRIREHVLRPGMRMPSVRQCADEQGLSQFTVVAAYERLVARGHLRAQRGSGFYVCEPVTAPTPTSSAAKSQQIDTAWLVRNMQSGLAPENSPGYGYLSSELYGTDLLRQGLRTVAQTTSKQLMHVGLSQGYLPLRQQLQRALASIEIGATPESIVLTSGSTQSVDLVIRLFAKPGDTVMVGDPAWSAQLGALAMHGAKLVSVPYRVDGPDLDALTIAVQEHRPRIVLLNTVLHNPTGTVLSAASAFRILKLAEEYDFLIVEDDIYADFLPSTVAATRLAGLDQRRRVIYLGSYSKTLAPNIRVGFLVAAPDIAQQIANYKLLCALSTPEINERIVFQVLTEGGYRKHCLRLHGKLDAARDMAMSRLERIGLKPFIRPQAGFVAWFDTGVDTNLLAAAGLEAGYLFAPGALFSPAQQPSTWMRVNLTTSHNPVMLKWLSKTLDVMRRRAG